MSADAAGISAVIVVCFYVTFHAIKTEMRKQGDATRAKLDSMYNRLHSIDMRGHREDMQ